MKPPRTYTTSVRGRTLMVQDHPGLSKMADTHAWFDILPVFVVFAQVHAASKDADTLHLSVLSLNAWTKTEVL